eukprot:364283-Chlamydomonas_euryale.AAC.1
MRERARAVSSYMASWTHTLEGDTRSQETRELYVGIPTSVAQKTRHLLRHLARRCAMHTLQHHQSALSTAQFQMSHLSQKRAMVAPLQALVLHKAGDEGAETAVVSQGAPHHLHRRINVDACVQPSAAPGRLLYLHVDRLAHGGACAACAPPGSATNGGGRVAG